VSRVGVTGHQDLSPKTQQLVSDALLALLEPDTCLVGLTSLANGADQIFARIVLELDGKIHAVVPSEAYGRAFPDEGSRAMYRSLLARASAVTLLPYPHPSEEAFVAAGRFIVDRSEKLVAIWDGAPAHGLGGTADIVGYANRLGVPVVVIWPEGASRDEVE